MSHGGELSAFLDSFWTVLKESKVVLYHSQNGTKTSGITKNLVLVAHNKNTGHNLFSSKISMALMAKDQIL